LTMPRDHVAIGKERRLARRALVTFRHRPGERLFARPHHDPHAEGAAIARDHAADPAIAVDAERLVMQRPSDADLPFAGLERRHLVGNLPHRGDHQPPRQFGGGIGRGAGMLAR
jgi:hypothetical protein